MNKLTKSDLLSLEEYSLNRDRLREEVLVLKKDRKIQIGINVTLLFENLKTIKYQIQEMLRIEKIFEPNGIQEELDAYNPLIPDGSNLKATMFIEFQKESVRKEKLKFLLRHILFQCLEEFCLLYIWKLTIILMLRKYINT